ncbi:hypothetical protein N7471_010438 [Penicillium samsonianum]|uniref:uncharacterized protein n=1 Tax=Penicillium samsonianum TaxID=1882272 RepID=UPI002548D3C1|nr:uncharacterized protein N7471_010438 [Penicillium samsonianum]KAJ6125945.1 hypothetical protein N7471_010438 [Penicillium samsonianum]
MDHHPRGNDLEQSYDKVATILSSSQDKSLSLVPSQETWEARDLLECLREQQESLHKDITNWFQPEVLDTSTDCTVNENIKFQLTPAPGRKCVSLPIQIEEGKEWRKRRIYARPTSALEASASANLESSPDVGSLLELVALNPDLQENFNLNGLPLIQQALKRSRPEQWELREMSINCGMPQTKEHYASLGALPDECTNINWDVESYLRHYAEEMAVCAHLTGLIRERCTGSTQVEQEVLETLWKLTGPRWTSVHRAFWRIWTFCRIFGCAKGREEDIQGQQRWLSGFIGAKLLVGATFSPSDGNSELLSLPPDTFGYGNALGLSKTDVQDMVAIWTFLEDLLRSHLSSPPVHWSWQPEHKGETPM